MRILILTHPRSGGMSLLTWINSELTYDCIHEPNLNNPTIKHEILTKNNIVVKICMEEIETNEFLNSFDKIIIHKRDNILDVALSLFYCAEKRTKDKSMHETYEFDDKWKEDYKDVIEFKILEVKKKHKMLDNINHQNIIRTSYDSIFYGNKDVIKICNYLNIINPKFLDKINNKRRLRTGKIGV